MADLSRVTSEPERQPGLKRAMTDIPISVQKSFAQYKLGRVGTQVDNSRAQADADEDDDDSNGSDPASSSEDEDQPRDFPNLQMSHSKQEEPKPVQKTKTVPDANDKMMSVNRLSRFSIAHEDFHSKGRVKKDGRLTISIQERAKSGYFAKAIRSSVGKHLSSQAQNGAHKGGSASKSVAEQSALAKKSSVNKAVTTKIPNLNIVVMVIGSRGDIQPFLSVGQKLKERGHRVRIASHPVFREFVEKDCGLEFFSVGGDPAELMAFMVKNPGLIPSLASVKAGEVGRRREQMYEMFNGFWRSCIHATDDKSDIANLGTISGKRQPFIADAIIANPPSFAHIHCAEKLGIPLHLMFTMPWTPTQAFAHPLAKVTNSNIDANYANYISYPIVDLMTWQGLGDLVNSFRVKTLALDPVSTLWQVGQTTRLHIPYTYLFSPGLVPKPEDWGPQIDISGFVYLNLADSFKPPQDLVDFLDRDDPPIYIGFGSIVVDDPNKFTALIFEAVKKAGVRALVSKGWGGLGDDNVPDTIYMLENTPHDWLFPRVSAVVHHGGAGTTAAGLKFGKPTMICSFFGDQAFWGSSLQRSGAGVYVPYKSLNVEKLANGIQQILEPDVSGKAKAIAQNIEAEGDAAKNAVESFHRQFKQSTETTLRCSMVRSRLAIWRSKQYPHLRLSPLAAELLVYKRKIPWKDLRLIRHHEWNDFEGPGEPISGGGGAFIATAAHAVHGVSSVPRKVAQTTWKYGKMRKAERMSKEKENSDENSPEQCSSELEDALAPLPGLTTQHELADSNLNTTESHPKSSSEATHAHKSHNLADDIAQTASEGIFSSGRAVAKGPMDILLAVAQGFHNAPRLYGDDSVRRPTRISGVSSGFRAARNEFVFGIYDGVSGLALHPYNGARRNGVGGFVVGIGRGLGGFVLKDMAAIVGPPAYMLKGAHVEIRKRRATDVLRLIRRARILQGQNNWRKLLPEQRRTTTAHILMEWGNFMASESNQQAKRAIIRRSWWKKRRNHRSTVDKKNKSEKKPVSIVQTNGK